MVEVLKAGMYDTIQDFGRANCQEFGVPFSGVMDMYSASLANTILGNSSNVAVLECAIVGPKLKFYTDTLVCITGADMSARINDVSVKTNTVISVSANDILSFGKLIYGCRAYISVLGGFLTEEKMSSMSMYQGITSANKLQKGDRLRISEEHKTKKSMSFSSVKVNAKHFETLDLNVYKGPEFDALDETQKELLFQQEFTISKDSNRMAYQFDQRLNNKLSSIITSLVLPGTVQLTPSGQLMVLMRDCQTTGGYPRIMQLSENAINIVSQKFFGDKIRFKCLK